MEGIEWKGCIYRIKGLAIDLLSLDELFDDEEDSWELMEKYLSHKATFLYIDLSRILSIAADEHKRILDELINSIFYCLEELHYAMKDRSIPMTQECHHDVALALRKLMSTLKIKQGKEKRRDKSCHASQDVSCTSSSSY